MKPEEIFIVRAMNEENNDFIITVGKHLATPKHFKTKEDAEKYAKYPKWDMIIALIAEVNEQKEQIKEDAKKVVEHITNKKS